MELIELVSILEEIAPPELADSFDAGKIGLILKGSGSVKKVATALDPTPYAINKAISMKAQALITHHTLIWNPVSIIDDRLSGQLRLLLEHDISLYAMHTNYDKAPGGVNDVLAATIGLMDVQENEHGRVGYIDECLLFDFARYASRQLLTPVEVAGDKDRVVNKVAVVAGSGFREGLDMARRNKADVLLSSELKHDTIRERGNVALISAPHYHTEAPAMKALAERLNKYVKAYFIEDPPGIEVLKGFERDI
jgi:dinuclear metal center YbgI/SA1388 family protein